ncbi:MAG: trimeric intracellular cation channel family protein [Crocinitomicaceae bacterium]|nr:trimeric intracellular cation channel family protein [Crocinitomicaceae bacterium]
MKIDYILIAIDHLGIFFFAISGLLTAAEKNLDLLGGLIIAFITALGGGTIRDLLLNVEVAWLSSMSYIVTVILGGIFGILFMRFFSKLRKTTFIFDTLGISLFTILGVQKSISLDQMLISALFLGMISSTFGGLLRDVLCNEIPLIFRKEIYAIPCIIGASLYIVGYLFEYGDELWLFILSTTIIATIRTLAVVFEWQMPTLQEIQHKKNRLS